MNQILYMLARIIASMSSGLSMLFHLDFAGNISSILISVYEISCSNLVSTKMSINARVILVIHT
uniref:Uncharacterized protein n=1 Tax=Arundo donax TaxID=35708 RepID=A0A0A9BNE1_ARUDO